ATGIASRYPYRIGTGCAIFFLRTNQSSYFLYPQITLTARWPNSKYEQYLMLYSNWVNLGRRNLKWERCTSSAEEPNKKRGEKWIVAGTLWPSLARGLPVFAK